MVAAAAESSKPFIEWRRQAAELAARLYGRTLDGFEDELIAGFSVGDTPGEFASGMFVSD